MHNILFIFCNSVCGHSGRERATGVVKGESDGGKQTDTSFIQRLGRQWSDNVLNSRRGRILTLGVAAVGAGIALVDQYRSRYGSTKHQPSTSPVDFKDLSEKLKLCKEKGGDWLEDEENLRVCAYGS